MFSDSLTPESGSNDQVPNQARPGSHTNSDTSWPCRFPDPWSLSKSRAPPILRSATRLFSEQVRLTTVVGTLNIHWSSLTQPSFPKGSQLKWIFLMRTMSQALGVWKWSILATVPDWHVLVFGLREACFSLCKSLGSGNIAQWFRCCHAVVGSLFKSLTFIISGRQWELIGMDGRLTMKEVVPAQVFRFDVWLYCCWHCQSMWMCNASLGVYIVGVVPHLCMSLFLVMWMWYKF